jgi:hypothetical protein
MTQKHLVVYTATDNARKRLKSPVQVRSSLDRCRIEPNAVPGGPFHPYASRSIVLPRLVPGHRVEGKISCYLELITPDLQ